VIVSRLALAAVAALVALAPAYSASRSLPITVQIRDAASCFASVDGSDFKLPDDRGRFVQRLKQLRKKWRGISIVSDTDVRYKCVGGVIFLAQSAKFKNVGFPAQPPQ